MSQTDLAESTDCTRTAVYNWEAGKSGIENAKLKALARKLRVDVVWLEHGKGEIPDLGQAPNGRRAIRFLDTQAEVSWSTTLSKPPFEGAIPEMVAPVGDAGPFDPTREVHDWWRISGDAKELAGASDDAAALRMFRVASDSVKAIPRGTYAMIDTAQTKLVDGALFAIDTRISIIFKRVSISLTVPGKVTLSDDIAPEQTVNANKLKVVGRVVSKFEAL